MNFKDKLGFKELAGDWSVSFFPALGQPPVFLSVPICTLGVTFSHCSVPALGLREASALGLLLLFIIQAPLLWLSRGLRVECHLGQQGPFLCWTLDHLFVVSTSCLLGTAPDASQELVAEAKEPSCNPRENSSPLLWTLAALVSATAGVHDPLPAFSSCSPPHQGLARSPLSWFLAPRSQETFE